LKIIKKDKINNVKIIKKYARLLMAYEFCLSVGKFNFSCSDIWWEHVDN